MADELNDVADNITQGDTWMRIVYMIGFGVVLYVTGVVLLFLVVAQALFKVFAGKDTNGFDQLFINAANERLLNHYKKVRVTN